MIPKFREWDAGREDVMPGKGMSYGTREDSDDAFLIRFDHMEDLDLVNYDGSIDRIVMMSTELKDKNGVEIYEGDVLEIPVAIDTKKLNGEVVFEDGVFGVKDVLYGWGFEIGLVPLIEIILAKKVIIVGNKYQHPHLLKE